MQTSLDDISFLLSTNESYGSIVGGLVGGMVGGFFAVLAQIIANLWQSHLGQKAERRSIDGMLQAIDTELTLFKTDFLDRMQQMCHGPDKPRSQGLANPGPFLIISSNQNYHVVFESNAAMLGRIRDERLREMIIRVYGSAKSLFDYLNYYSRQSDALAQIPQPTRGENALSARLEELEQKIKTRLEELQRDVPRVQESVRAYLANKSR
jgi:hypothetical protein